MIGGRELRTNESTDKEVYRWLKTCSVLINLSEIEALGITIVEALAARKGAIVNNKLGLAELAREFEGAVFPVNRKGTDPAELATAIEQIVSRRIAPVDLEEFHWNRIANEVFDVYRDACKYAE